MRIHLMQALLLWTIYDISNVNGIVLESDLFFIIWNPTKPIWFEWVRFGAFLEFMLQMIWPQRSILN